MSVENHVVLLPEQIFDNRCGIVWHLNLVSVKKISKKKRVYRICYAHSTPFISMIIRDFNNGVFYGTDKEEVKKKMWLHLRREGVI